MPILVDPSAPPAQPAAETPRGLALDRCAVQVAPPTVNPGDDDDDEEDTGNIDPDEDEGDVDEDDDDEDDPLWARTPQAGRRAFRRLLRRNIPPVRPTSHWRHTARPAWLTVF